MKLGSKIGLGFLATNLIYVALSLFILLSAQPVRRDSTSLSHDLLPMLDQASQVQYSTAMEGYMTQEYSRSVNADILVEALTYNADVVKYLNYLEKNVNSSPALRTPEIMDNLKNVRQSYQQFRDLADLLPQRLEVTNAGLESIIYGHENFKTQVTGLINSEEANQMSPGRDGHLAMLRNLEYLGNELVINTLRAYYQDQSGFAACRDLADKAYRQAAELSREAKKASLKEAGAELAAGLEAIKRTIDTLQNDMKLADDESIKRGQLADATIKYAAALREAADRQSQKVANGSSATLERVILFLIIGVVAAAAVSTIMAVTTTKGITRPINALIATLSEGSREVEQASGGLSRAADSLAAGAKENAGSLQDISSALEELSSMTRRNAENSLEANSLMTQATGAVEKAEDSMGKVIKAMGEISSSGNQIAKIIKTIDDIAFQTNLLALNAAVEAARAGEAGSGFAVVADEVRNLATRSAEAAKNTAGLIDSTIANINSGSNLVSLTEENFKLVQSHAGKVAQLLSEVAEASREQSQGIGQINNSMNNMDKITQSNASSADDSARAASGLSGQAAELLSAVDELTSLIHGRAGRQYAPSAAKRGSRKLLEH